MALSWEVFGWNLFALAGIGFLLAFLLTAGWTRLGNKWGLLDLPRECHIHSDPRPFTGGLAIFLAFSATLLLTAGFSFPYLGPILGGGVLILALGFFDDCYDFSPGFKFLVQLAAATFVTATGVRITYLTNPFGEMVRLGWAGYPLTILWLVATINMMNLIDGLDGLAGGIATIAGVSLLFIGLGLRQAAAVYLCAILVGVLIGFLPFNFYPARVFMGNSGAYFLGYLLGVISVLGALKLPTVLALVVPVFAMGIPFIDTVWAVWRRWRGDRPLAVRDDYHIHHLLLTAGLGTRKSVLLLYGISAVLGAASVFLSRVKMLIGCLILVIGFVFLIYSLRRLRRMESDAQAKEGVNTLYQAPVETATGTEKSVSK